MRIFSAVFWAVILIVIGVVIILNQAFDWNISIFAIVLGIILVSVGVSIITGPSKSNSSNIFSGGEMRTVNDGDNNYFFSSVVLNLDESDYDKIEINSIFSSVKLNTNGRSVVINSNGAFSNTVFPDKSSLTFGERTYERDGQDTVQIETNCVFASIIIE